LKPHLEAFYATSDWGKKSDIAVYEILKPYLVKRPKSSEWLEEELKCIFDEAQNLPDLPKDATRYFCKKKSDGEDEDEDCVHYPANQCWCYFKTTASAGIPTFLPKGDSIRKDKKACITFVHNLVTQFLMILAQFKMELWDDEAKWTLHDSIKMTKQPPDDDDDDNFFDDDRTKYLDTDSDLQKVAPNKSNEKNDLHFRQLCSTLGRRMLTLAVCIAGDGLHFVEKKPIWYWDVADRAKKASPRANVDKQLYPTRVINTRTYEFETDVQLYQNEYAILSHTWTTKGKEVEYHEAEASLLRAKIAHSHFDATTKKLKELAEHVTGRKYTGAEIRKLQEELDEKQEKETTLNQTDDAPNSGEKKLARAIAAARKAGFTYLWVDNCCIDKKNNTELVEAISSMGDWYKNAKASSWIRTLFLFRCRS